MKTALLNYKEDHATVSSELDAVLTYLDKLKPQCETKVMSARPAGARARIARGGAERIGMDCTLGTRQTLRCLLRLTR